jgi:hypothetical protein
VSLCTRASVDGATLEPLHPNSHPDVNVLAQAAKTALSANGPRVMAQASDSQYKFRPKKKTALRRPSVLQRRRVAATPPSSPLIQIDATC